MIKIGKITFNPLKDDAFDHYSNIPTFHLIYHLLTHLTPKDPATWELGSEKENMMENLGYAGHLCLKEVCPRLL